MVHGAGVAVRHAPVVGAARIHANLRGSGNGTPDAPITRMVSLRRSGLVFAVLACAAFAPGCYAQAGTSTVTSAEVDEYPPAYYDGYVVYYDNVGNPFYYDRGAVVWVPHSSPHYVGLGNHYHVTGRSYGRWNNNHGGQYRNYRAAPGYHAYHGYNGGGHAPPAHGGRR